MAMPRCLPAATPLAILLFIAFAFLVIATITTPVIKQLRIAVVDDVYYGVLGYCKGDGDGNCSGYSVGYDPDKPLSDSNASFSLSHSIRNDLTPVLIVHPVAALLSLTSFSLTIAMHFRAPGHSPRFLLAVLLLLLPTFLVTLLAFIIDILVFEPHLAWGGWLVLASTVLHLITLVLLCFLRRSLISRKATQKRFAEREVEGEDGAIGRSAYGTDPSKPDANVGPYGMYSNYDAPKDGADFPPPGTDKLEATTSIASDRRELLMHDPHQRAHQFQHPHHHQLYPDDHGKLPAYASFEVPSSTSNVGSGSGSGNGGISPTEHEMPAPTLPAMTRDFSAVVPAPMDLAGPGLEAEHEEEAEHNAYAMAPMPPQMMVPPAGHESSPYYDHSMFPPPQGMGYPSPSPSRGYGGGDRSLKGGGNRDRSHTSRGRDKAL
ncbi:regulator of ime2 [Ascosphaera atra]|nr:regulator of ime2 [Ascosphaera atra]